MFEVRELHRPYPGLRPFEADELSIFFGREAHVSRLLEILGRERFLAVIGPSGAGKSSLVKAGLLPSLALGWTGAVSDWRIAELRPGERPLRRLAQALLAPDVLGRLLAGSDDPAAWQDPAQAALLDAELRRGRRGLIELMADALARRDDTAPQRPPFNLLVLVDQFEELFRFAELGSREGDEAESFVNLLLLPRIDDAPAAARIHVALTMRTDALHECARFLDLPETINRSQYLVPRLRPDELRRAIAKPALVFGGEIEPDVVERLVRDVQGRQDQLPVLQHALSQMWERAAQRDGQRPKVTDDDVREVGGIDEALSRHANGIFHSLTQDQRRLADLLLRAITAKSDDQRDARRPQRLDQITEFAGLERGQWELFRPVLEAFAAEGANFVRYAEPLGSETVVDISHEALIRRWDRLRALVDWETSLAAQYRRWRDRSEQRRRHGGELLGGSDLYAALDWRDGRAALGPEVGRLDDGSSVVVPWQPSVSWARRYSSNPNDGAEAAGEFDALRTYIDTSDEFARRVVAEREAAERREVESRVASERERADAAERERRMAADGETRAQRLRWRAYVVAALALVATLIALVLWRESQQQTKQAAAAEKRAQDARVESDRLRADAEEKAKRAEAAEKRARNAQVESVGLRLASEGQSMLARASPGTMLEGLQRILASHRLSTGVQPLAALQSADTATQHLQWIANAGAPIFAAAFSPDGQLIVSASDDKTLRLWDARTGSAIGQPLRGHDGRVWSVAFSPDGQRIVSASDDKTLRLWDARTGSAIGQRLRGHDGSVNSVAFSPDGQRIVSASVDNTLRLWDARTGSVIGQLLRGHEGSVRDENSLRSVAFSPDGQRIVAASDDKTLRLWTVFEGWAERLCGLVGREMTAEEWSRIVGDGVPQRPICPGLKRTAERPKAAASR